MAECKAISFDLSLTVNAAPRECVIRTGQIWKAENEAWIYLKVTVSSSAITSVII